MTNPSWDPHGEVRGALRAVVADPELGTEVLSSPRVMSNILRDFLPDAPRGANLLIAASDADVPGKLRTYLAQGMDAGVAQGIVASVFAEQTALTQDACQWVVHEIAIALGVPPQVGISAGPKTDGRPVVSQRPTTVDKAAAPARPTSRMAPPPPAAPAGPQRDGPAFYPGQPARPSQPVQPAQPVQPQFQGQPQYPVQPGQPPYPGQPPPIQRPAPYQAQQPYLGQPPMLPYDQVLASAPPRRKCRRNVIIAVTTSGVAVLLIVAFLYVLGSIAIPPTRTGVNAQVTGVPVRTLDAVGSGRSYSDAVHRINGARPLTKDGKPEVLYIGAAFCPFCAANQWSIIVALSRFGTFAGLTYSHSSPKDSYPNTATLTFDKATYTSKYLTFVSVESQNVNRQPLQNPTKLETSLWKKYGHFYWPFMDVGNRFYTSSLFDPALLHGKSQKQIAAALSHPSSPIAQAVDGSANRVTAAICSMTGNQPTSVCGTPTITAIERAL
ncbi:MAG TPA: DUF929 family protein [Streptosporangiaceae bacterium]|nr:DUF929 family protein [Streptosporangiaceae bacterium]